MKLPYSFWAKRFVWQGLIWSTALSVGLGFTIGLWYPASHWLFADGWQWMPFEKWLTYVLVAIPGGLIPGALFTLGDWLQHDSRTLKQKIIAVALVLLVVIYPCVFIVPRMIKSMVAALL